MYKKLLVVMGLLIFLAGCSLFTSNDRQEEIPIDNTASDAPTPALDYEETVTVKIYDFDIGFMDEYGRYIQDIYPELSFEFVPLLDYGAEHQQQLEHLMESEGIDVLFTDYNTYTAWAEEGRLLELDHLIMENKFQIEGYSSNVINFLRAVDGRVYGLSPKFTSSAIYYNTSIFDRYEEDYPHDQMTWEEVIELAERVSAENEIYGLDFLEASDAVLLLAGNKGLAVVDERGSVTIDSQEWQDIWDVVIDLYDRGVIHENRVTSSQHMRSFTQFLQGQVAMVVASNYFLWELEDVNFEWDLSPEPMDSDAPNESLSFMNYPIYVIPVSANNVEGAWKVIEYINSSQNAKRMLEENPYELVSRESVLEEHYHSHLPVFYERTPSSTKSAHNRYVDHPEANNMFISLLYQNSRDIFDKNKEVEQVLAEIKEIMEQALQE